MPGVERGRTYGVPALKVGGKMFACMTSHRSAEPGSLAVRMDFDRRDELIAADSETYYLTDHYVGYPCVLVRLKRVTREALEDLLGIGYRFVSARQKRPARRRRR